MLDTVVQPSLESQNDTDWQEQTLHLAQHAFDHYLSKFHQGDESCGTLASIAHYAWVAGEMRKQLKDRSSAGEGRGS